MPTIDYIAQTAKKKPKKKGVGLGAVPGGTGGGLGAVPPSGNAIDRIAGAPPINPPAFDWGDAGGAGAGANPGGGGGVAAAPKKLSYDEILAADPIYQGFLGQYGRDRQGRITGTVNDIIRALAQLGDAGAFESIKGDLNADLLAEFLKPENQSKLQDLIASGTSAGTTTLARLAEAYKQNLQSLHSSLASRGLKGEAGSGSGRFLRGLEDQEYNLGGYEARQNVTDAITGLGNQFGAAETAANQDLLGAGESAQGRYDDLYGETPIDPATGAPAAAAAPGGDTGAGAAAPTATAGPTGPLKWGGKQYGKGQFQKFLAETGLSRLGPRGIQDWLRNHPAVASYFGVG